jgi:hypothetical protein
MTGPLVARMDASHLQRSLRWALQAVLVVVAAHLAVAFLVSAVIPLVLDTPVRRLSTPRGRLLGLVAQVLCVLLVGVQSSYLSAGIATVTSVLLAAALQTLLVFAAAYVVSRIVAPSPHRA